jgi:hypothetical protein
MRSAFGTTFLRLPVSDSYNDEGKMADQPSEKVVDKQTDKERAVLVAAIDKRLERNSVILSDLRQSASTWQ